jgi:fatty acid desaturase
MFFGESPETYYSHHMGMHHPENNLLEDRSTTIVFRRDSFIHFMYYFLRFFIWGLVDLSTYLYRKKRYSMMIKTIIGEYSYLLLMVAACYFNFQAGIILFVVPYCIARFGMMAGNWGQHAFVDIEDPNNCHRNSLTCINSSYNKRGFNDGYHISHHLKGNRHWSEHPQELIENKKEYIKERAIIFEKLDFFGVWLLLMLKQHRKLARYYVNLDDKNPKSVDQILEIFESRLVPVTQKK